MIFMFIYGHMPVPNTICLLFIQSWKLSIVEVMVNLRRFFIYCDLSLSKSFCWRRKKRWQWQIIPLARKWSKYTERQKQDRIFILAMTFCPYTHEIRCLTKVVVTNWTNLDLTFDTLWNTLSPYRPSVPLRRTMGLFFFKSARQVILAPNLQAMSCPIDSHASFW